ncbi:hypothetical protein H9Q69_000920 [Fusarium xylarioides]|nr:hypothetical protein H9Q70_011609 [Fusarium xylarioides]KAG5774860.1 hypothetical protein H9Q73_011458 [Fusarium xylarioides]KAG5800077.1 hypothetical protein H9Q69_000920 [Fusarium xylarioides]
MHSSSPQVPPDRSPPSILSTQGLRQTNQHQLPTLHSRPRLSPPSHHLQLIIIITSIILRHRRFLSCASDP